jgi:hypothetical protein
MNTRHRITMILAFAVLAFGQARAQLTIGSTVTAQPGTFLYSYEISNQTSTDVAIVTLGGLFPALETVQNLTAPAGLLAFFDSGLGLLSFVEGTDSFFAGTTSGTFTFQSMYGPGAGFFEAIDVSGNILVGNATVPSLPPSAVPEPATTAALGALVLLGLVVRRKFTTAKASS